MTNPLFSTVLRANCGCGWHPVRAIGSIVRPSLQSLTVETVEAMIAHAEATGHTVELAMEIQPLTLAENRVEVADA